MPLLSLYQVVVINAACVSHVNKASSDMCLKFHLYNSQLQQRKGSSAFYIVPETHFKSTTSSAGDFNHWQSSS